MNFSVYDALSAVIILLIALNIRLMASPKTAVTGNRLGALAMCAAIAIVLVGGEIIDVPELIACLLGGGLIGLALALKVTTLQIPQFVALLNGLGGAASLLVSLALVFESGADIGFTNQLASFLAIAVGGVTFSGSVIAAAKLDGRMEQRPTVLRAHTALSILLIALCAAGIAAGLQFPRHIAALAPAVAALSLLFGFIASIRIGGADMPVSISLLNSYSGLAASICGFAINDFLLVSVGAVVGAAGLILTKIMCKAMNRSLSDILTGGATRPGAHAREHEAATHDRRDKKDIDHIDILRRAGKVIIVPGYGMAVSQAQWQVKALYDSLVSRGTDVKFAIHPVAGRMPGHMNVLLAEVDIPYEKLCEMDTINPEFGDTDVAIVIGACDVVNPAAISAEGTPIYGMPILMVHEAGHVIVCNKDTRPGYSGVDNPLYEKDNVVLLLDNAADSIETLHLALA